MSKEDRPATSTPATLISLPPIPSVVDADCRNTQGKQITHTVFVLQPLRLVLRHVALPYQLPACLICHCGLIDIIRGCGGGDACEACDQEFFPLDFFASKLFVRRRIAFVVGVVVFGPSR